MPSHVDSSNDPVHALVPHSPKEPIQGAENGPLKGRSFMVKDMFAVKGLKVSNGNPGFYEIAEPAAKTAPAVQALLDAGATLTGMTICDEFFYSLLGDNAHYGAPINPRSPDRHTGGSSCGAAAAVAAGMCDFALGADTGGSVRIPAAFCGLYGLRPTYARISLEGATPMAPRFDTAGFFARDPELFREVGHVLLDDRRVEGEIGQAIVVEDMFEQADPRIVEVLGQALARFGEKLPPVAPRRIVGDAIESWREAFRVLQGHEIQKTLLPTIRKHDLKLGPGIGERFEMAAKISDEEADEAQKVREKATMRLQAQAQPGNVMVLPTAPTLPPKRDEAEGEATAQFRKLTLQATCLSGHAGLPQITIPAGEVEGCSVGLSFIGWHGGDEALLNLAVKLAS
ncbi:MAG: amidase [Methyloligella sp. ZOD6]